MIDKTGRDDEKRLAELSKEMEERGLAVDFRSLEEIDAARIRLNRSPWQKLWAAIKRLWARWRYRNQQFTLAELDAAQGPPGSIQTAGEIDKALKDLKGRNKFVNPDHTNVFPWVDPGRYTPGYDPERGATVHPDSIVIRPYIGSTAEEEDAQKPILPRRAVAPSGRKTCPTCFGWAGALVEKKGFRNGEPFHEQEFKDCRACGGKGWV